MWFSNGNTYSYFLLYYQADHYEIYIQATQSSAQRVCAFRLSTSSALGMNDAHDNKASDETRLPGVTFKVLLESSQLLFTFVRLIPTLLRTVVP